MAGLTHFYVKFGRIEEGEIVFSGVGWAIVPEHIAAISEKLAVFPVEGLPVAKQIDITVLKHLDTTEGSVMKWLSSEFARIM